MEETLTGLRVIKGFNAEDKIENKFKASTTKFRDLMTSVIQRKTLASPMSEFLGSATIIAILWFGGRLVLSENSDMQPQEFFGYIGLFYLVLNPAKAISTAFYSIQKGNASAERIIDILETKNTIVDTPNATVINNGKIIGRGGDGGDNSAGAQAGGPAISVTASGVTIDNASGAYIAGGGGGPGGGGGNTDPGDARGDNARGESRKVDGPTSTKPSGGDL